jgi:hypothetical protein
LDDGLVFGLSFSKHLSLRSSDFIDGICFHLLSVLDSFPPVNWMS